ncbi:MAG: hypothetical protein M3Y32_00145 [Pseudomonadota bacterium]|nr:hypothetical protein [Pseudomonadota bacterium]
MVTVPERWAIDGGDSAVATLVIPADARRERRFEIACAMTVALPAVGNPRGATGEAWHQMTVQANGTEQWRRRVPTHNPGQFDGLDYRFSRSVPVGQSLRLTVSVATGGARRRSLQIEADQIA